MSKLTKIFSTSALMLAFVSMTAATMFAGYSTQKSQAADTTDVSRRWLPGEIKDTLQFNREHEAAILRDFSSHINLLSRAYGDSIVLRWAPDDYVTWRQLSTKGVNIYRHEEGSNLTDTLAIGLKPSSLDEFRRLYGDKDSLANMAMGMLYGKVEPRDKSHVTEGSLYDLIEEHQDKQMMFGIAVLTTELRQDLANHLAMRFVDKNVKKGKTYRYEVAPSYVDPEGKLSIYRGETGYIKNEMYKPEPLNIEMGDSVLKGGGLRLWWTRTEHSAYEVERRVKGASQWKRLNERPYVMMIPEQSEQDCFYSDLNLKPGAYEYRILAHDAFGDLVPSANIHTVVMPDVIAPRMPSIKYIEIIRPNKEDPAAEVWAEIHVAKDTIEADLMGMAPVYYHEKATQGKWRLLTAPGKMMAPTDTVITINVTDIPSGQLAIAAFDTAYNVSYSIPQLLRVADMRPPKAPKGLKAETSLENGTITLTWNKSDEDDVSYYEVVYANDTTHTFMTCHDGKIKDTLFVDSVALDVNQKYIYYKVRAVDYATNTGEYSEVLQVIRPSAIAPSVAHLDSTFVDGKGVYMRWIAGNDEQMAYHKIYRKLLKVDKDWTLLRVCNADSVKQNGDVIEILDHPKENSYEEYAYYIESFNYSHVSSGPSLQYITRFTGDPVFKCPINLVGDFVADKRMTKLAWDVTTPPAGKDWFFCVWRQGPGDDRFKFLMSAEPDERDFTDYLLRPGQEAQYYIQIQMEDGRESEPSNIVTIKAPAKK